MYAGPGGKELPLNTGGWAATFPWFGQNAGTSLLPWPSVYLGMCAMVGEKVVRMTTSLIICYVLDRIVSLNLLALSRRSVGTFCYGSSSCPRWVSGERECCENHSPRQICLNRRNVLNSSVIYGLQDTCFNWLRQF